MFDIRGRVILMVFREGSPHTNVTLKNRNQEDSKKESFHFVFLELKCLKSLSPKGLH